MERINLLLKSHDVNLVIGKPFWIFSFSFSFSFPPFLSLSLFYPSKKGMRAINRVDSTS